MVVQVFAVVRSIRNSLLPLGKIKTPPICSKGHYKLNLRQHLHGPSINYVRIDKVYNEGMIEKGFIKINQKLTNCWVKNQIS